MDFKLLAHTILQEKPKTPKISGNFYQDIFEAMPLPAQYRVPNKMLSVQHAWVNILFPNASNLMLFRPNEAVPVDFVGWTDLEFNPIRKAVTENYCEVERRVMDINPNSAEFQFQHFNNELICEAIPAYYKFTSTSLCGEDLAYHSFEEWVKMAKFWNKSADSAYIKSVLIRDKDVLEENSSIVTLSKIFPTLWAYGFTQVHVRIIDGTVFFRLKGELGVLDIPFLEDTKHYNYKLEENNITWDVQDGGFESEEPTKEWQTAYETVCKLNPYLRKKGDYFEVRNEEVRVPTKQGYISTKLSVPDGDYCLDGYFMPYRLITYHRDAYVPAGEWEAPKKAKLGSIEFTLPKHIPFTKFKSLGVAIREGRAYLFGVTWNKYGTTEGVLRYCLGDTTIPACSFQLPEKFIQKTKKLGTEITLYTSVLEEEEVLVVGYGNNVEEYLLLRSVYYFLPEGYHKAHEGYRIEDKDLHYGKPDFFQPNCPLNDNFVLFNSYSLKLKLKEGVEQITIIGDGYFDKYINF